MTTPARSVANPRRTRLIELPPVREDAERTEDESTGSDEAERPSHVAA